MREYTRELAAFAAGLSYLDLPAAAVAHTRLCGSTLPWSRTVAGLVCDLEGPGPCSVWGSSRRVSPAGAALANGTAVHGFELDDLHKRSIVHAGACVVTAALAIAEHLGGAGGRDVLAAIVAGYEVA